MSLKLADWDNNLPIQKYKQYQAFVRQLCATEGFSLLFVCCSSDEIEQVIFTVKKDVNHKNIEVLHFDKTLTTVYEIIDELDNKDNIHILLITGLESSLYGDEECQTFAGWSSKDIYSYSLEDVPPLLININQQKEILREQFSMCFVFLLSKEAIQYFIQNAPDFFNMRSGYFDFYVDSKTPEKELNRILAEENYAQYLNLTSEERVKKIFQLQELLEHEIYSDRKAKLFVKLGDLQFSGKYYTAAISYYDKALEFKPDDHEAWFLRGNSLDMLGRYEEAVASYNKALELKPDDHEVWFFRGNSLYIMGRDEEAVVSYNKALEFGADDHEIWKNRGNSLHYLGKYEEAILSYKKALEFKPNDHEVWYNRGNSLHHLGKYEQAVMSYEKALVFQPDDHESWKNRGNSLHYLDKYETAVMSYEKALELKPNDHEAWYNRGNCLHHLGKYEQAVMSYEKALVFNPDDHEAWYNRGNSLHHLGKYEQAVMSYEKALELKPDKHEAWYNRGNSLPYLGRYEEAIASYNEAKKINPDFHIPWYKKAILILLGKINNFRY